MRAIWKNHEIDYLQDTEFHDLKREVLDGQIYWFETEKDDPIILDVGAHIGLATIYFKWLYPGARVWAFEPNPELFALLERNVRQNDLSGVELINAAVGRERGEVKFYVDATPWQWWSVGSLRPGAWNGQQKDQKEIIVKSVKLIDFVQNLSRVDLLKLDVEGAETQIIMSLGTQLAKVQHLIFEFHPTKDQNLTQLQAFLVKRGFEVSLKNRRGKLLKAWHEEELVLVEATRSSVV